MLRRMEGLAPARLIHVLARGRASAAWSHLYARHSPKLESWNASTRRNGPNTLLGSTAQHSNRQRDRRDQDSPDPEPSRAGLFGGHHVRKWLPAKHRRPQARGAMPGLVRRNACKMLVESSGQAEVQR